MTAEESGTSSDVEALLQRHLSGLRGFVRLRTGAELRALESTSDLVQSVCREILEHKDRFAHGGEEGFRRWLYTSALRKIVNRAELYRTQKRDPGRRQSLEQALEGPGARRLLQSYGSLSTPSRALSEREQIERIEAAFDTLPDDYREVITLSRIARLSHAQIAEHLGRSEGAVRMLLFRALERLSALLESK